MRGIDVITAYEGNHEHADDFTLLDRANYLSRVLFTQDDDFLNEAAQRQRHKQTFQGVIYAYQLDISIGQCIEDLELVATLSQSEELDNQVLFLPL
ncbi:MAG: DUF5615 family PIN-like protein [Pseudomonadota bacterium]